MSVNVTVTEKENVELKVVSSSTDAVQLDLGNTQHNSLVGIQGGAGGEYYHLSLTEYSDLINTDNQSLYVNITGAETITGLKTFVSGIQISANSEVINITGDLVSGNKKLFIDSESLIIGGGVELKTGDLNMGTNSITNVGNIDGRDVSADGSKLDGIETAATADQTAAEIRSLVESATDSNVFTDDDHSKLNAIEASADVTDTTNVVASLTAGSNVTIAADGTVSSSFTNTQLSNEQVQDIVGTMVSSNTESGIAVTYDDTAGKLNLTVASQTDHNFTNADHSKLDGIESGATADQTAAEIRSLVESATDSNVFTDADHSKLDGIETAATADQTASEIRALVESASDSNVFTDSDHTKLDGVEAGADVTPSWVPSSDPSYATETYVGTQVANLVDSAPNDLNTLNELAEALGDDENFATTVNNNIATKLPLAGGTMTGPINMGTNEITNVGNVDGRDVSADGLKLDGIESEATADQTAAEIRTLVESASDSNVFTDADHTKLNAIEASADVTDTTNVVAALTAGSNVSIAADGTISSTDTNTQLSNEQVEDIVGGMVSSNTENGIAVTYDDTNGKLNLAVTSQTDQNFTNDDHDKLDGIEDNATADQTAAEIRTLVESATDSNVFTDADHTKLNTSVSITGSQTISGIKTFDSGYKINAGGQDIIVTGDLDGSDRKLYIDAEALIVGENEVNSLYSAAILGSGNKIFGDYDVIAGGELNIVSGENYSVIIGGRANLIELGGLGYNTINGGTSHSIKRSTASLVDGGYDNDILGASNAVIVGGQSSNITSGTIAPDHSIILGGENNNIQDASNAIVVGGAFNFASGSFSTVMAGRGGRAIHEGSMVLADGKVGRSKTSFAEHGLTIDFASGVDVPTGNLIVAEDITMGGDTVATRTWVENRDLGQRFDSVLPSGVEETGVLFPTAFSSAPMVQSELQLPNGGERTYFIAVRDITTTGFFVEFSDNIGAGYVLQTRAIPNT